MRGNDEMTRIEASGSPNSRKMLPATKRRRKSRGMPPPAAFDIDTLPSSSNLTALEAAAVIRRTPGALEQWRRDPNHQLLSLVRSVRYDIADQDNAPPAAKTAKARAKQDDEDDKLKKDYGQHEIFKDIEALNKTSRWSKLAVNN